MLNRAIVCLLSVLFIFISGPAFAQTLFPMQVGQWWEYDIHDSDDPPNEGTVRMEILNMVTIGSYDYSYAKYTDWNPSEISYHYFRSTENEVYYYGGGSERPIWKKADIGTTWSYLDPDGVGTAYAEIVSVNSLDWEVNKDTLTIPYGQFSFDNIYIHKKYYNSPDKYWYEYLVPGMGIVKDYDFEADINPPHIQELSQVGVAPEPLSSTLFIVGSATLGFRHFRNKFKK